VFNKSLIVGSGMTARPGTVLTAGRSYAWLTFAAHAKESVLWIFSGCTPLVAAGLNPSVNPTLNQMFTDLAESEVGESVPRAVASSALPMSRGGTRAMCCWSLLLALRPVVCRRSCVALCHIRSKRGLKPHVAQIIGGWNRCLFPVFGLTHEHGVILSQG